MKQILIAIDQLINTLIVDFEGYRGFADETISSRCWRMEQRQGIPFYIWVRWFRWRKRIDWLFSLLGEVDHCKNSYTSERLRLQLPPELRGCSHDKEAGSFTH